MPAHNDYASSIMDVAEKFDTPIVTTNWYGLNKNKCTYLPPISYEHEIGLPAHNSLFVSIMEQMNQEKNTLDLSQEQDTFKIALEEFIN
jgi:hypothetical protein